MENDTFDKFNDYYSCKLKINNIQVPIRNIQKIVFREWIFDPICSLEISILDTGVFIEMTPLFDESPIEFDIIRHDGKNILTLNYVLNDFEYEKVNVDGGSLYAINMTAFPKSNQYLYPATTRNFLNMTSEEVVAEIANDNDMNYVKHTNSNDNQNWFQIALNDFDMIKHIIKKAYIKQEDLPLVYMDRHNNINYNSLQTMCVKEPKYKAYCDDILVNDVESIINKDSVESYKKVANKDVMFFKTGYKFKSIASSMNKDMAYGVDMTYFDHKNFYRYVTNFNISPLSTYANINKNNKNLLTKSYTFNTIHRNSHKNYLIATIQNPYIKTIFFNSYLQIVVNVCDVNLGDIIDIVIPDSTSQNLNGVKSVDVVNSGKYLVGGIMQDIRKDGYYGMVLTLFRNGVNDSNFDGKLFEMLKV